MEVLLRDSCGLLHLLEHWTGGQSFEDFTAFDEDCGQCELALSYARCGAGISWKLTALVVVACVDVFRRSAPQARH